MLSEAGSRVRAWFSSHRDCACVDRGERSRPLRRRVEGREYLYVRRELVASQGVIGFQYDDGRVRRSSSADRRPHTGPRQRTRERGHVLPHPFPSYL